MFKVRLNLVSKPVLIGMNNPASPVDPTVALFPAPSGCTGHRLWKMLNELTGAHKADYLRAFDRRNLLSKRVWDPMLAAIESKNLWDSLKGRTVLVLGNSPCQVLHLPTETRLLWNNYRGVRWCLVPHPSGRNHWYNIEINRELVALRLEELYVNQIRA